MPFQPRQSVSGLLPETGFFWTKKFIIRTAPGHEASAGLGSTSAAAASPWQLGGSLIPSKSFGGRTGFLSPPGMRESSFE
jgi:hypothetical protein